MAPSVREGRGGGEARSGEKIQGAWPWGDGRSVCVRLRDMRVPLVVHVTHVLCFSLLSPHPVLRTHNLTVLPSHNSTFVRTNDSAYSNLSATVGEHLHLPSRVLSRRDLQGVWSPVPLGSAGRRFVSAGDLASGPRPGVLGRSASRWVRT